jgi:nickel transport protein
MHSPQQFIATIVGLILVIGPAVTPNPVFAHGTGYRQAAEKSISLEFYYSTGETMSYLETKVFSPKDEKFAFQSGRTDEAGRFAFTPNVSGLWRVIVKDEEGHLAEAKIDVTSEFLKAKNNENPIVAAKPAAPEGADLFVKAGLGVSLLFNMAAFLSLARRRKTSGEMK